MIRTTALSRSALLAAALLALTGIRVIRKLLQRSPIPVRAAMSTGRIKLFITSTKTASPSPLRGKLKATERCLARSTVTESK